jgi:N6-L-threonylcarbamoyladenine synthase
MEREGIAPLPLPDAEPPQEVLDLVASFREAAVAHLIQRSEAVAEGLPVRSLVVAGGVAANSLLRARAETLAERKGWWLHVPVPQLCADNGAMIAAVGERLLGEGRDDAASLDAHPSLTL